MIDSYFAYECCFCPKNMIDLSPICHNFSDFHGKMGDSMKIENRIKYLQQSNIKRVKKMSEPRIRGFLHEKTNRKKEILRQDNKSGFNISHNRISK